MLQFGIPFINAICVAVKQIASSDERLRTIKYYNEKLHDRIVFGLEHTKMAEKLVALYEAEHFWTPPMGHEAAAYYANSIQGDTITTAICATKSWLVIEYVTRTN